MTSAPKSASCDDTALPATSRDRSTTRIPSSGQVPESTPDSNDLSCRLIDGARHRAAKRHLSRGTARRKPRPPAAISGIPPDKFNRPFEMRVARQERGKENGGLIPHILREPCFMPVVPRWKQRFPAFRSTI